MATYLELVRRVASDSGTWPDPATLTTLVGLTGRAHKFKDWTARAWERIQTMREDWRWMQADFSGSTVQGQQGYDGADLGVASRFGAFVVNRTNGSDDRFTLFDPVEGQGAEGPIRFVAYDRFRAAFLTGTAATHQQKPVLFTIAPDGRLLLSPIPDKVYTLRGVYRKNPQILSADADEPEMPARFHDLIVYEALTLLAGTDEAGGQLPVFRNERARLLNMLEREQLPVLLSGGALD